MIEERSPKAFELWSPEDIEILKGSKENNIPIRITACKLGRTIRSCQLKQYSGLKCSKVRRWSPTEEAYLEAGMKEGRKMKEIASELSRTVRSCSKKSQKIKKKLGRN